MYRYRLVIVLSLLLCALRGIGTQAQSRQSCDQVPPSATEHVGVVPVSGYPGDTVWVSVYADADSALAGFFLLMRYDQALVAPATSVGGDPVFQKLGRFATLPDFFVTFSEIAADSGAIVAAFNFQFGIDTITVGADPIFRIPFIINENAAPGDSARFWFPRTTDYVIDSTVFPPDTLQSICRGSQFSEQYNAPAEFVNIWPTPDESYLRVVDHQPIITSFSALPRSVWAGSEVTLHWTTNQVDSVAIEPSAGVFTTSSGWEPDYPETTTTYTITAYGGSSTVRDSMLVHVVPYGENRYPWLDPPAPLTVVAGQSVSQWIYGFDPDGVEPDLATSPLPGSATFVYYGAGLARLSWTPGTEDTGLYSITLYATDVSDPLLIDSLPLTITVVEANYPPTWDFETQQVAIYEHDTLSFIITAADSDGVAPSITANTAGGAPLEANMSFVDLGGGAGLFTFVPDYFQGNDNPALYYVGFRLHDAVDSTLIVTTPTKPIRVYNRNSGSERPQIQAPPDSVLVVTEGDSLIFDVTATTTTGDLPVLSTGPLPTGASLTSAPGTTLGDHKVFRYYPGFDQGGVHEVEIFATNVDSVATATVTITVNEGNQVPWLFVPPGQPDTVTEGNIYHLHVLSYDPDSTIASLSAHLDGTDSLATNMTFVDSGNGAGLLTFAPDLTQGSSCETVFYYVKFRARDAAPPYPEVNSATYTIKLFESGLACCVGTVGDVDYSGGGAGEPNIGDLTRLVDYLFRSQILVCPGEADIDGGGISVSDVTALVAYLFSGGGQLPSCP